MGFNAVVLAAGRGVRLQPLTLKVPKALIELKSGYTILDRQLFDLRIAGAERVAVTVGYLADQVQRHLEKYGGWAFPATREGIERGTLISLLAGWEAVGLDKPVIVRNGDVVADVNLRRMMQQYAILSESGCKALIYAARATLPYGALEISGGRVTRFVEKPVISTPINGGIYIFSPKVYEEALEFEAARHPDIERTLLPKLAGEGVLYAYQEDVPFWLSADSLKDLQALRREYENRVDKPWGWEKLQVLVDNGGGKGYMSKQLYIMAGMKTSTHMHMKKHETLYLQRGRIVVSVDGEERELEEGMSMKIEPKTPHCLHALRNSMVLEYSTPHPDDVVRLADPYAELRVQVSRVE